MHINLIPEDVMGKILSSSPTKLAASTSLLSKKWRNVFALVHNLDFDDSVFLQPEEGKQYWDAVRKSFRNFMDITLALQCASPIKKYSLKYHIDEDNEMDYVGRWMCNAIERGVLELDVSIKRHYEPFPGAWELPVNMKTHGELYLPCELFMSKTLVKLTLGTQISLGKLPLYVSLPALKILFIDSIIFRKGDMCYVLLYGCPVLEELFVRHEEYIGEPILQIERTIKKLKVDYDCEYEIDLCSSMSFDAPSLISLDYSDYALFEYKQVNFESLVEARLDLHYSENIERPLDVSGLIKGIRKVETLHLSPASLMKVISRCVKHGLLLPVFNNLVNLSFGSKNKRGHVTMSAYGVKVLHILDYRGTMEELKQLKKIIGEMEFLELVQVDVTKDDDGIIMQTKGDIMMMLLGVLFSSKCQIKVRDFI